MKKCDICGNIYPRFDNYCFHCGVKNHRRNKCLSCGYVNKDNALECSECENPLIPVIVDDIEFLLINYDFYKDFFDSYQLTPDKYNEFLDDIFLNVNPESIKGDSIKEIILNFAKNFAHCFPKSTNVYYGYCNGEILHYDDRLSDSIQTVTILHELTHVILYQFILYLLCDIFHIKPSLAIKELAWDFLSFDKVLLLNEYCANSIESSFAPFGYHNYGSFENILENMEIEDEEFITLIYLGNVIIEDILTRLNSFIPPELKKQIEIQYIKDRIEPNPNFPITGEIIEKLDDHDKCLFFMNFLKGYYKQLSLDK